MASKYLPEETLIEFLKPRLKALGFQKKNKRWTKESGSYTLVFYIQGSAYNKEAYYVRPGVFMNGCTDRTFYFYGHFFTEIKSADPEEILGDALKFFEEWSDTELIVRRAKAFVEWGKRNPLEKRRSGAVDYEMDPVPSKVFFPLRQREMDYILNSLDLTHLESQEDDRKR